MSRAILARSRKAYQNIEKMCLMQPRAHRASLHPVSVRVMLAALKGIHSILGKYWEKTGVKIR